MKIFIFEEFGLRHKRIKYFLPNSYEPELFPGAKLKINELKASLTIFATGSVTAAAPSVDKIKVT